MSHSIRNLFFMAIIPVIGALSACDGRGGGADDDDGVPLAAAPNVDNAMFELGRALFFDKELSGNRDVACASCHHPDMGTDDDLALSRGVGAQGLGSERHGGELIGRNAPALFNLHAYETMFWDGRVEFRNGQLRTPAGAQLSEQMSATFSFGVVAAQAMFPVVSRTEMRGAVGQNELAAFDDENYLGIWAALMTRLGKYPQYVEMFERAYPGTAFSTMTFAHAANAIAGYEIRAFERVDSPYQRYLQGDDGALSNQAERGREEFFDVGCGRCHNGPLLSDFEHHNTGLAQFGPGVGDGVNGRDDFGRGGVTGSSQDRYEFRTTPLINIQHTGPFGHAGQFADLVAFIDHYHNADRKLRQYDMRDHVPDTALWSTAVDNRSAIEATIERDVLRIDQLDAEAIAAFLREASSSNGTMPDDVVPTSVPSGLLLE